MQRPAGVVEHQFFGERVAQTLRHRAFHLPFGLHRVDGGARVHRGRQVQHADLAGLGVHFHFGEGRAEGRRAVGIEVRRAVHDLELVLVHRLQRDVAHGHALCGIAQMVKTSLLPQSRLSAGGVEHLRGDCQHLRAHLLGRLLHRAAGDDGGAGGVRADVEGRDSRYRRR